MFLLHLLELLLYGDWALGRCGLGGRCLGFDFLTVDGISEGFQLSRDFLLALAEFLIDLIAGLLVLGRTPNLSE